MIIFHPLLLEIIEWDIARFSPLSKVRVECSCWGEVSITKFEYEGCFLLIYHFEDGPIFNIKPRQPLGVSAMSGLVEELNALEILFKKKYITGEMTDE